MSDLCIYELDDNVWDEFGESDDHIVPHAGDGHRDQFAVQGDSCKKRRQELNAIISTNNNATKCGSHGKEGTHLPTLTKTDTMMEKDSWPHSPDDLFPSSDSNTLKEVTGLTSDDASMSRNCFKSGNELFVDSTISDDKCAVGDDNVCQYQLNQMSQTDNEYSFLDNDREDKESSDLSYYSWQDIGNFEDVDRLLRSCDSTFGMGSLSNEEELWLPASYGTEGSDDLLKSDFKFSCAEASPLKCVSDYCEDSKANSAGPSVTNFSQKNSPRERKMSSQSMDVENANNGSSSSSFNVLATKGGHADNLSPEEQMQTKLSKHQRPSKGTKKNDLVENGDCVHPLDNLKQYAEVEHPHGSSSSLRFSHTGIHQHKQGEEPESLGYVQTCIPFMHKDYSHASDHVSVCPTLSGAISENNSHLSPPKESSYASNIDSSLGCPLEASSVTNNEKKENVYSLHDAQVLNSFKNGNMASPMQVYQSENEVGCYSEVGGLSLVFPQELNSSNMKESSSLSYALNEISLEATSFRQLQQVTDQLDIRTKLCIRDSLYRLARSAEQRHNCANINGNVGDDAEACKAMMAHDTNSIMYSLF
ncbi:Protein LNK1 isoform X2 [Quillaja saponaria]|uniref:Protein LNK1 isoform X2 n=1 Tax=Quillaja saponaria TaxID=32244 RepID=A0AAD7M1F6_QUISA|nr:Protein LNK1 isoform X2 [Quillaja saponaria]